MSRIVHMRTALVATIAVGTITSSVPYAGAELIVEGSRDQSFGISGRMLDWSAVDTRTGYLADSVVQPDGKVLALSNDAHSGGCMVTRYRTDGSLDPGFGHGGRVVPNPPSGCYAQTMALQGDGRILIAGETLNSSTGHEMVDVFRLFASGALDTSFGSGGEFTDQLSSSDSVRDILQQPNGKILIGGISGVSMLLARLTSSGQLDSTFGTAGIQTYNYQDPSGATDLSQLALMTDGRIVAVGTEYLNGFSGLIVTRWTPAGQFDPTFSGGVVVSLVTSAVHAFGTSVLVQPDGKVVAGGYAQFTDVDGFVARYNTDGSDDTGFGTTFDTPGGSRYAWDSGITGTDHIWGLARQRDGKIVATGDGSTGALTDFMTFRLTTAGALDPNFEPGSNVSFVDFAARNDRAATAFVRRDGRIVLAGDSFDSSNDEATMPALAQLVGDKTNPGSPTFSALPMFSLAAKQRVRWLATDDNTGVKSYDVQRRTGSYTSPKLTGWKTIRSQTAARYVDVKRAPGVMTCFRVRARDWAGNVGGYSSPHCTTFPVDDRKLSAHGSWSSLTGSSYYLRTARRSSSAGSSLTISASFRQLAVVATTCPTCGKVKAFLGKSLLGTLNLHSTKAHTRVLEFLPATSTVRSGTLRIVQVTGGKRVTIDGFGLTLDSAA